MYRNDKLICIGYDSEECVEQGKRAAAIIVSLQSSSSYIRQVFQLLHSSKMKNRTSREEEMQRTTAWLYFVIAYSFVAQGYSKSWTPTSCQDKLSHIKNHVYENFKHHHKLERNVKFEGVNSVSSLQVHALSVCTPPGVMIYAANVRTPWFMLPTLYPCYVHQRERNSEYLRSQTPMYAMPVPL